MLVTDFEAAYGRIRQVLGLRTQTELAGYLGIRQSSISDAKRRGSVPAEWLLVLIEREGINPAWIKSAQEPKFLKDPVPREVTAEDLARLEASCLLDELRRRCPGALVSITFGGERGRAE